MKTNEDTETNCEAPSKYGIYHRLSKRQRKVFDFIMTFTYHWMIFGLIDYGFLSDSQKETGVWGSVFFGFMFALILSGGKYILLPKGEKKERK